MALRDLPYFPLYVQDYLTDEKLSCCSLSTQGVYMRILCILHKSETYGGILFKQIPKQNFSTNNFFAFIISKQIGVNEVQVEESLEELLFFKVLQIEQKDGVDFLFQKRMVHDFTISCKRSDIAKKGGGNPKLKDKILFKQTPKQKHEYEDEYEYDNEDNIVLEKKEKKIIVPFAEIVDAYNSICISLPKCSKLTEERKKKIKQRWNEMERDMSKITELFTKTEQSDFCTGKVKEWTANFDWLFENSKNWVKVVEGNYDNKIVPTKAADHDRYHSDFASDLEERWLGKKSGMA